MPDLDHRFMTPPSLRISDRRLTPDGTTVATWDLRVAQPNVSHLPMQVAHSMEHFLATYLKEVSKQVVVVAPMGCQTGFYIVTVGLTQFAEMAGLLVRALERVVEADAVPLADAIHCGWAENHSLAGVAQVAAWLLQHRQSWHEPARPEVEV